MVSISWSDSSNFGISSCGRAIPRVRGSRSASTAWRFDKSRQRGAREFGLSPLGPDCVAPGAILLSQHLALGDELIAFRRHRLGLAQAFQAMLRADESGVERKCTAKIGGGGLLVATRLVDVPAVVVGQRISGIELNGGGVVGDGLVQISSPASTYTWK